MRCGEMVDFHLCDVVRRLMTWKFANLDIVCDMIGVIIEMTGSGSGDNEGCGRKDERSDGTPFAGRDSNIQGLHGSIGRFERKAC